MQLQGTGFAACRRAFLWLYVSTKVPAARDDRAIHCSASCSLRTVKKANARAVRWQLDEFDPIAELDTLAQLVDMLNLANN